MGEMPKLVFGRKRHHSQGRGQGNFTENRQALAGLELGKVGVQRSPTSKGVVDNGN